MKTHINLEHMCYNVQMWQEFYTSVRVTSATLIFIWQKVMKEYQVLDMSSKKLQARITIHMIVIIQMYNPTNVLCSNLKPSYITNTFSACESLH